MINADNGSQEYVTDYMLRSQFLDALASLDLKLSVTGSVMFFGFSVISVITVIPVNPVIPVIPVIPAMPEIPVIPVIPAIPVIPVMIQVISKSVSQ